MEINELMTWVKNDLLILLTAIGIIIGILALLFGKEVGLYYYRARYYDAKGGGLRRKIR